MKSFTINKHSQVRGAVSAPTPTDCVEAYAAFSERFGYRLTGFDPDGRRWSIAIDERLIDDLTALRGRRYAPVSA